MDWLPSEVLVVIFNNLDDRSLLDCEKVCVKWKNAIIHEKCYAKKCERIVKNDVNLASTFAHHKFHSEIKDDHEAAKAFYLKLRNLSSRWSDQNGPPSVYSYYCKTGEVPDEWVERHNYTGVYDMVWLPEKSFLICSCYDTIQVWNMVDYTRVSTFEGT